jgi:hypothetical protein
MSHQEKLARADEYLQTVGLPCKTDKTYLYRFLRRRGFELKPMYWESFYKNVTLKFVEFFLFYFSFIYLFSLVGVGLTLAATLVNALLTSSIFAIMISTHHRYLVKKHKLIDWEKI